MRPWLRALGTHAPLGNKPWRTPHLVTTPTPSPAGAAGPQDVVCRGPPRVAVAGGRGPPAGLCAHTCARLTKHLSLLPSVVSNPRSTPPHLDPAQAAHRRGPADSQPRVPGGGAPALVYCALQDLLTCSCKLSCCVPALSGRHCMHAVSLLNPPGRRAGRGDAAQHGGGQDEGHHAHAGAAPGEEGRRLCGEGGRLWFCSPSRLYPAGLPCVRPHQRTAATMQQCYHSHPCPQVRLNLLSRLMGEACQYLRQHLTARWARHRLGTHPGACTGQARARRLLLQPCVVAKQLARVVLWRASALGRLWSHKSRPAGAAPLSLSAPWAAGWRCCPSTGTCG
jgi:hypothetical protein